MVQVGDLRLDPAEREVHRGRTRIRLSAREFALLEVFMRRPGQTLSKDRLVEAAWELAYERRSNVVEVYVRYLRDKIDRPFGVASLETVRGAGYRLPRRRRPLMAGVPLRVRLTARVRHGDGGDAGRRGACSYTCRLRADLDEVDRYRPALAGDGRRRARRAGRPARIAFGAACCAPPERAGSRCCRPPSSVAPAAPRSASSGRWQASTAPRASWPGPGRPGPSSVRGRSLERPRRDA